MWAYVLWTFVSVGYRTGQPFRSWKQTKLWIKIKPPGLTEWVSSFLTSTKNKKVHVTGHLCHYHGSTVNGSKVVWPTTHDPLTHFHLCYMTPVASQRPLSTVNIRSTARNDFVPRSRTKFGSCAFVWNVHGTVFRSACDQPQPSASWKENCKDHAHCFELHFQ